MKHLKHVSALLLILAMLLALGACGGKEEKQVYDFEQDESLKEVVFALDATPNALHAGLYAAWGLGCFKEEGLRVTVKEPDGGSAEMYTGTGAAHFGVSAQDVLAPGLTADYPVQVTAVMAILPHNTAGIVGRRGFAARMPKDLEGKRYGTWDNDIELAELRRIVEADEGSFHKVELVSLITTDEFTALLRNEVEAIRVDYAWAGCALEVAGVKTEFIRLADIDPVLDYYSPVVIAYNGFLRDDPDTAKAFLRALKKGYEYVAKDPDEGVKVMLAAVPELEENKALLEKSMKYLSSRFIEEGVPFGYIDPERWNGFYTWLSDNELTERLYPGMGFSNEFNGLQYLEDPDGTANPLPTETPAASE